MGVQVPPLALTNEHIPTSISKNHQVIWHYLKRRTLSMMVATVASLLLAAISSFMTVLVGPMVQVLAAEPNTVFTLHELVGEQWATWITSWTSLTSTMQSFTLKEIFAFLPELIVVTALAKALAGILQWYLWERTGEKVSFEIRAGLMAAYLSLPKQARQHPSLEAVETSLSSTLSVDIKLLREYLVHFYGGFPRELLQVIFLSITLITLAPNLFLLFFIGILPVVAIVAQLGRKLRRRASKALEDNSTLTEWIQQRFLGIETIKHCRTEPLESQQMHIESQNLHKRFLKAARVKARTSPLIEAVALMSFVGVLSYALFQISTKQTSGSVQFSFFAGLALWAQATAKLGRYFNSNKEGHAAVDRIRSSFSQLELVRKKTAADAVRVQASNNKPKAQKPVRNTIVCQDLCFTYIGSQQTALSDLSYTFEAGKIYCICGPTGAGKSTLLQLLLQVVNPSAGRLEFFSLQDGGVGYLPQHVQLAPLSLAENISYPHTSFGEERVLDALRQVDLESLLQKLPDGLDTQLGEGGHLLSGGQAQRVLLARLIYQRFPFVIIDEGTSALDPELESKVQQIFRKMADDGVVVVTVAHRTASIFSADEVIMLQHGRLYGSGDPNHPEIRKKLHSLLGI